MALGSQHAHTSTSHPKVSNDPVNHSSLPSMQLCLVAYAMLGTCCPPSSTVGCLGSCTSFSDLLFTSPSLATSGVLNVIRSFSSLAKQEEQQVETDLMRLVKHLTLRNRGLKGLIEVSSRSPVPIYLSRRICAGFKQEIARTHTDHG